MKIQSLKKPGLTEKQNRQFAASLITVIAETVLCAVYVILLLRLMTDTNYNIFIIISFVFYFIITVVLCLSIYNINKLTKISKNYENNKKSGTEGKADD